MTDKSNTEAGHETEAGSGDMFNTAAGWILFAGIVALGLSILAGKFFHGDDPQRPETPGYEIQGVVSADGGEAEMTMAEALNMMPAEELIAAGESVFAKCQACHTLEQGGANGVGPNLYGVMGSQLGQKAGFGYSSALTSKGGSWGWEEMNQWLAAPRRYIDGTTMGFAGLSSIEDRAAVAMYMNTFGSNLPVPEYVAEAAEGSDGSGEVEGEGEEAAAEEGAPEAEAADAEAAE